MKKVEAFISPAKLDDVIAGLVAVGAEGLTMMEVRTRDGSPVGTVHLRGGSMPIDLFAQLKLEIVVADFKASQVVEAIRRAARTGQRRDGQVLVVPMDEALRIRTGETGEDAI